MSIGNNLVNNDLFYMGQGSVLVRPLDENDKPIGNFVNVGSMNSADVSFETDSQEIRETQSGSNNVVKRLSRSVTGTLSLSAKSFGIDTIALGLYGDEVKAAAQTGATMTATVGPGAIVAPDGILASVTSIESGAMDVYVEGENFVVSDGAIEFLRDQSEATTPLVADTPITITYSTKASRSIEAMVKNEVNIQIVFTGVNTANSDDPLKVTMHKVSMSPTQQRGLISVEQEAELQIQGTLMSSKAITGTGLSRLYKEETIDHDAA